MKKSRPYQVLVQAGRLGLCRTTTLVVVAAVVAVTHERAFAHEIMGLTGFASLLAHPVADLELVLGLLALAVLALGQTVASRVVAWGLASGGALIGTLVQTLAVALPGLWRLPLVTALAVSVLVTLGVRGRLAVCGAALAIGIVVGLGVPRERPGTIGLLEVPAAAALTLGAMLALAGVVSRAIPARAVELAGPVAGSWIIAIAVLGLLQSR